MRRTKAVLAVTLAALLAYLAAVVLRSVVLAADGGAAGVAMAVALVAIVAVAVWAVAVELRFGLATQRLGHRLAREGGLPADDLPRTPAGRLDRAAADAAFEQYRAQVEDRPSDWRAWYRLAWAYDAAGDRRRGRQAARQAVRLARSPEGGSPAGE